MFGKLLVPIDIEHEDSWQALLPAAARIAATHGAELHVLYVVPPFSSALVGGFFPKGFESKMIETAKQHLAGIASKVDLGGIEPELHVAHGTIYEEVIRVADTIGADLIVLGALRPDHEDFHLGTNSSRVARHARQSTLVLRQ